MRIQIDTEKKEIHLLDRVQLEELMDKLNTLFPDGSWKEYTLDVNTSITWIQPVQPIIQPYIPPWQPDTIPPWTPSWPIIYGTSGDGVFNISI